jgi:hypothetical protein
MPQTGSSDIWTQNFQLNPQVEIILERIMEEYPDLFGNLNLLEPLQKACFLKYRDIIAETVAENNRRGEFVRIYPAKNSKIYDRFFSSCKNPLNKIIYKVLFSSDVLPYSLDKMQIKKGPPPRDVQSAVQSKKLKTKDIDSTAVVPEKLPIKERVHSATGVRAVPRVGVNLMMQSRP